MKDNTMSELQKANNGLNWRVLLAMPERPFCVVIPQGSGNGWLAVLGRNQLPSHLQATFPSSRTYDQLKVYLRRHGMLVVDSQGVPLVFTDARVDRLDAARHDRGRSACTVLNRAHLIYQIIRDQMPAANDAQYSLFDDEEEGQ